MWLVVWSQFWERDIFLVTVVNGNSVRVKATTTGASNGKWYYHFRCDSTGWWDWSAVRIFGSWYFFGRRQLRANGRSAHWWPLLLAEDHGLEFGNLDGLFLDECFEAGPVICFFLFERTNPLFEFDNLLPVVSMQLPEIPEFYHSGSNDVI
jgi:hypothetical protein